MAIILVTDTASDMEFEEYEQKNIVCVPLPVTFEDVTYERIEKDVFFEKLVSSSEIPHTSQPSPEVFCSIFEKAKQNNDTVIAILLSGALSGTYSCAVLAKDISEYDNIYLIDSQSATLGMKLLVDRAVSMRDSGCTAEEIVAEIESLRNRTKVLAVMDTLHYLYKGGRLSRSAAGIGTLANLKPLITLSEDGAVSVVKKAIGKNRGTQALLSEIEVHQPDTDYPIYAIYSMHSDNCDMMSQKFIAKFPEIPIAAKYNIGAVIGTHIGPGAFGFVYIEKK